MATLDELIARTEQLLEDIDGYLAENPSARIRNGRNQATWLIAALQREQGQGRTVVITQVVDRPAPAGERWDAHEVAMTERLIASGELPQGSTPAAFREWQDRRRAKMAAATDVLG